MLFIARQMEKSSSAMHLTNESRHLQFAGKIADDI